MEKTINLENTENFDMEASNIKVEKMRYQNNSLSYMLGMLGIIASIFAAFVMLNSYASYDYIVIPKILMNIVILLFGFISCEKVKAYSKNYSIFMMIIGGVCVARIFWFPIKIMTAYASYSSCVNEQSDLKILQDTGGLSAVQENRLSELSTLIAKYQTTISPAVSIAGRNWLPQSGYFRGIVAIILLALAATAFIFSGIICYKKNKMLTEYLASIHADSK